MRRLSIYTTIILLLASPVFGASSPVMTYLSGGTDDLHATSTEYMAINGNGSSAWNTLSTSQTIMAARGVFTNLHVELRTAPGSGNSFAFTLMISGAATNISCTISDTDTECDSERSATVLAGEDVVIRVVPTSSPTVGDAFFSLEFRADSERYTVMTTGSARSTQSGSAVRYYSLGGNQADPTEFDKEVVMPFDGTLRNLYVELNSSPNLGGSYLTRTRINGANGNINCTINSAGLVCNDISNTDTFSAGDTVSISMTPSLSPGNKTTRIGIVVEPDEPGVFGIYGSTDDVNLTGGFAQEFMMVAQGDNAYSTTELNFKVPTLGTYEFESFYVETSGPPDSLGSDSITYQLKREGSAVSGTCVIAGNNTTCNQTYTDEFWDDYDDLNLGYITSAGGVAAVKAHWGIKAKYTRRSNLL